jgi:hypothetical protein
MCTISCIRKGCRKSYREMPFYVFLSRSGADKPAIEELPCRLAKEGIQAWSGKWYLVLGDPGLPTIERALGESEKSHSFGPGQNDEVRTSIDRLGPKIFGGSWLFLFHPKAQRGLSAARRRSGMWVADKRFINASVLIAIYALFDVDDALFLWTRGQRLFNELRPRAWRRSRSIALWPSAVLPGWASPRVPTRSAKWGWKYQRGD